MKRKKRHKFHFPKNSFFLLALTGLIIFWLAIGFFLFFIKNPTAVYLYPENPKQGDTVFIRVKSNAEKLVGGFADENLFFYKKINSSEWISFLGIDAAHSAGEYKIYIDTSDVEHLVKSIKVDLADFSLAPVTEAPNLSQTGITKEKAVNNVVKSDNPAVKKILGSSNPEPYFTEPFSFPLEKVEKTGFSFGRFIGFAESKLQHLGVDLRATEKTEIYSVNDGKVVAALDLSNYGKTIIIDHGLDIFSLYLHLEEFDIKEGDMVKKGQIIGLSGDTGYVTAPHLHFSMRVGGSRVDPISFIEVTKKMNENFMLADITNAFLNIIKK